MEWSVSSFRNKKNLNVSMRVARTTGDLETSLQEMADIENGLFSLGRWEDG
jgi:hypothetical protein